VWYRFFFSMTLEEVAKQTDCSVATVHRELAYARAFLTRSGI
jgi:DNA-directed RNA polymerase specialized sigma24 family protein